jgi:Bax protein
MVLAMFVATGLVIKPGAGRTDGPVRPVLHAGTVEPVGPADAEIAEKAAATVVLVRDDSGAAARAPVETVAATMAPPFERSAIEILRVRSATDLSAKFAELNYSVDAVRELGAEVPRISLASFPADLGELESIEERKALFFGSMLPLVLQVNESILRDRWQLLALRDRLDAGEILSGADLIWLTLLAQRYGLERIDIDELVLRVDIVPPSMALAQSAVESGWGTSRFAVEGNAVFGQITFAATGIVPLNRKPGETHLFAAFDALIDGTQSYVRNLNTHRAYAKFRQLRAEQRARGERLDGSRLLDGLLRYSELGQDYIDYVRGVIRANDLDQMDHARLAAPQTLIASSI